MKSLVPLTWFCSHTRKNLTLKYYAKKILYFLRQQNILKSLKSFLERPAEQQSPLEGVAWKQTRPKLHCTLIWWSRLNWDCLHSSCPRKCINVHHWALTSHPLSWTCSVGAVLVDRYCNPLADITLSSISAQLDEIAEKVKKMLRLKNPSHPTLHVTQGEVFKLLFVFSIACFSSLGDVSLVVVQGTVLRWRTLSSRGRSCAHLTLCCTSSFSTKATSVITTILSTRISTR